MERPDLDGIRLARPDTTDIWLVFGGRRHRIASPAVYEAMFGGNVAGIVLDGACEMIDPGPELNDGTCLIRASNTGMIFLLTGSRPYTRILHVKDYESFLDFEFDMERVIDVPQLIIDTMPWSKSLVSAGSRTYVHAFSVSTAIPEICF